jgi:hypothetical protein
MIIIINTVIYLSQVVFDTKGFSTIIIMISYFLVVRYLFSTTFKKALAVVFGFYSIMLIFTFITTPIALYFYTSINNNTGSLANNTETLVYSTVVKIMQLAVIVLLLRSNKIIINNKKYNKHFGIINIAVVTLLVSCVAIASIMVQSIDNIKIIPYLIVLLVSLLVLSTLFLIGISILTSAFKIIDIKNRENRIFYRFIKKGIVIMSWKKRR